MIRIDELYNNTFWPWLEKNRPGVRMFMCDPFGRSDPDSVINYGCKLIKEHDYIFFFDQEPIHLDYHTPTFERVIKNNLDLSNARGYFCSSECDSENVDFVCKKYGWQHFYYFFHGWAALDWYRGYDKTFLIQPWQQRTPTKTFISPNRIIAGERKHRLALLYWIFKLGMQNNHMSCPVVCPAENISIYKLAKDLPYADAEQIFSNANLPIHFAGETDHPMHSCWLSLFDQSADSLLYLVTETVATGRRQHLTEKTFKPIALGMPFVLVSTQGSLAYLRSYGFKTFSDVWDESYDLISNDEQRIAAVAQLVYNLDIQTVSQKQKLFKDCAHIIKHNWNHFYHGGFEKILWKELKDLLHEMQF